MNRTARYTLVAFAAAMLLAPLASLQGAESKSARPNIVFILAADKY